MGKRLERQSATPMLAVDDAERALQFYKAAFGAIEVGDRIPFQGKIGHAEFRVAGALVMIADEFPEFNRSPKTLGGTAVMIHVYVDDVDTLVERAVASGGKLTRPITDQPYGRIARIQDPFGHMWVFNGPVKGSPP